MPAQPPKNPVTPEAREAFVVQVGEWVERLGLRDWRWNLRDKPSRRYAAAIARCVYDARLFSVELGEDLGGTRCTEENIEALAFHEVCHVFLKELITLARNQDTPEEILESAEHRVINILTRLLVPNADL